MWGSCTSPMIQIRIREQLRTRDGRFVDIRVTQGKPGGNTSTATIDRVRFRAYTNKKVGLHGSRIFGPWAATSAEAILKFVTKYHKYFSQTSIRAFSGGTIPASISAPEPNMKAASSGQSRPTRSADSSAAACPASATSVACPDITTVGPTPSLRVHQVLDESFHSPATNMSDWCRESQNSWLAMCRANGYEYTLWRRADVEALIQRQYPDHWDRYRNFPFSELQADFAKIVILHSQGGLYVSMDAQPSDHTSTSHYRMYDLGLCEVLTQSNTRFRHFRLDVMVARAGHPFLGAWMTQIPILVAKRCGGGEIRERRVRFVYATTGPGGFARFVHSQELCFTRLQLSSPSRNSRDVDAISLNS